MVACAWAGFVDTYNQLPRPNITVRKVTGRHVIFLNISTLP